MTPTAITSTASQPVATLMARLKPDTTIAARAHHVVSCIFHIIAREVAGWRHRGASRQRFRKASPFTGGRRHHAETGLRRAAAIRRWWESYC